MGREFWDTRYSEAELIYGAEPNDFLKEMAPRIPPGPVLGLGEGQGRNAVYLATLGHAVTAVDQSPVGLARARELATSRGVTLSTVVADLAEFDMGSAPWSGIISIFCHLPSVLRRDLYPRCAAALAPGGVFILEGYTPRQLEYGTGGPKEPDLLGTLDELRSLLPGLELEVGRELLRDIREGAHHQGLGAVVQVVARKPTA
ncbi:class I SAM-dependent methyltransferase [Geothrix mesophila]|uniref:class I SAM-dependent methyltransferase n=1 Tax=Geothrix mesophila TaxID=2922723 RepID=UPI001FADB3E2|nr:class I SAM-dependent methyltransferase [Geothrix sp. SG198]